MNTKTSPFDSVTIGPLALRNRFIKSGANEAMSKDGRPTHALVKHHRELAAGGIGMTTVAYIAVSKIARTLPNQIWMRSEIVDELKVLTSAVHEEGAAISAQITHGGSFVTGMHVSRRLISACSGFNPAGMMKGNFFTRGMKRADMDQVIAEFVAAAKLARDAGFDAVELHMGHGYLLNQFISPLNNRRQDEYGGPAENRVRFPAEVLKAVKDAVGEDIAVLAKINVSDGISRGADENDAIVTAKALEAAGADMLVLSGGRNVESTWFMFGSNMNRQVVANMLRSQKEWITAFMMTAVAGTERKITFKEMYFLKYSRAIRQAVTVPLAYLGGIKSLANAGQAMDEGFECVVIARALLHEPALVNKFQSGELTASGCDNCNACVAYIYHPDGTRCIHRPENDPALSVPVSIAF